MRSGHQTRKGAIVETCANTTSGFILSYVLYGFVIVPLWDLDVTYVDNFAITCMFTVTSFTRSYIWRRVMTKTDKPKIRQG